MCVCVCVCTYIYICIIPPEQTHAHVQLDRIRVLRRRHTGRLSWWYEKKTWKVCGQFPPVCLQEKVWISYERLYIDMHMYERYAYVLHESIFACMHAYACMHKSMHLGMDDERIEAGRTPLVNFVFLLEVSFHAWGKLPCTIARWNFGDCFWHHCLCKYHAMSGSLWACASLRVKFLYTHKHIHTHTHNAYANVDSNTCKCNYIYICTPDTWNVQNLLCAT